MRLTKRDGNYCDDCVSKEKCHRFCVCDDEIEMYGKLKEYEDAEENGLLVRLPCKVGDTLFVPSQGTILSGTVDKISVSERDVYVFSKNDCADWAFTPVDFGTTVFLTCEEAEAALKDTVTEMYDTLIADLRKSADLMRKVRQSLYMEGDERQLRQAADAIEDLQKLTDAQLDIIKQYQAYLTKQQWVPATEPPKEGKPVFVHIPCRYRKQESIPMIAFWEQDQWKEYETHRTVYNITHWMSLPEPPKEET